MSSVPPTTMPSGPTGRTVEKGRHELELLQNDWFWFLALGIALTMLGAIAVGAAPFATVVTVVLFGVLLMAGGIGIVVSGFWAGQWSASLLHLLIGVLYLVVGALIVNTPIESAAGLTLILAAFFMTAGIFRMISAIMLRFHQWGWTLLSGFITLLLGILIVRQWPASGFLVIGLFIGIEMIFNGWSWIMIAVDLRKLGRVQTSGRSPA